MDDVQILQASGDAEEKRHGQVGSSPCALHAPEVQSYFLLGEESLRYSQWGEQSRKRWECKQRQWSNCFYAFCVACIAGARCNYLKIIP